jgi:hypothetical protein
LARLCDLELAQLIHDILNLPEALAPIANAESRNDPALADELITKLESLLVEDNASASSLVRASADLLRAILGNRYADFVRHIDAFNYDDALAILRAIAPSRPSI